jgi:hypothetical protein
MFEYVESVLLLENLGFNKTVRSSCVLLECKNCINAASYSDMFSFVRFKDFYFSVFQFKNRKAPDSIKFFLHYFWLYSYIRWKLSYFDITDITYYCISWATYHRRSIRI